MRSAVFFPTPGMRTSFSTSPRRMCAIRSGGGQTRENLYRQRRADAADRDELFEQRLFVLREEAVERQRVFANMGVDAQPDFGADVGQLREGGDRDGDVVSDAARLDDGLVGMLFEKNAAQMSEHEKLLTTVLCPGGDFLWTKSGAAKRNSRVKRPSI